MQQRYLKIEDTCNPRVEYAIEPGYPGMRNQATNHAQVLASGGLLARIIRQTHGLSLESTSSSLAQVQPSLTLYNGQAQSCLER